MNEQNQIQEFLQMLDDSGFPDDRKKLWRKRLASDVKAPADQDMLMTEEKELRAELLTHLDLLDQAVEQTEAEIAADSQESAVLRKEALPYLQRLAAEQPARREEDLAEYQKDVLAAEKRMMGELEGTRKGSEDAEIDAIRKKLLS